MRGYGRTSGKASIMIGALLGLALAAGCSQGTQDTAHEPAAADKKMESASAPVPEPEPAGGSAPAPAGEKKAEPNFGC